MVDEHNNGCRLEKKDDRDDQAEQILGSQPFDWRKGWDIRDKFKLKVESQNGSLSCVGQAISKYAEIFSGNKDLSARDVYSRIYLEKYGGGAYIRNGFSLVVKRGVCSENMAASYECFETKNKDGFCSVCNPPSEKFMRKVPVYVEEDALKAKAERYAVIKHNNDIDTVADIISRSQGAVTGVNLTREGWKSHPFVRPPQSGEKIYGHAILLCAAKMIKGKKTIIFLNSYGKNWGNLGYGYLDEDYFKSGDVFNIRIFYYNKKTMKIIGHKKTKKQYLLGEDNVIRWIFNTTLLEQLHSAGIVNKNEIEWVDNISDYIMGDTWAIIK